MKKPTAVPRALRTVHVLIDWDTASRLVIPSWKREQHDAIDSRQRARHIEGCFNRLQDLLINFIEKMHPGDACRVLQTRIYHGWHTGATKSKDRVAWELARGSFTTKSTRSVSYVPEIAFGNDLICGGRRVPLLDTLRLREHEWIQKMVDTAMVADLLCLTRTLSGGFVRGARPNQSVVVVADDDDLFPGVLTAEAWGLPIFVARVSRTHESTHLASSGLVHPLSVRA